MSIPPHDTFTTTSVMTYILNEDGLAFNEISFFVKYFMAKFNSQIITCFMFYSTSRDSPWVKLQHQQRQPFGDTAAVGYYNYTYSLTCGYLDTQLRLTIKGRFWVSSVGKDGVNANVAHYTIAAIPKL